MKPKVELSLSPHVFYLYICGGIKNTLAKGGGFPKEGKKPARLVVAIRFMSIYTLGVTDWGCRKIREGKSWRSVINEVYLAHNIDLFFIGSLGKALAKMVSFLQKYLRPTIH